VSLNDDRMTDWVVEKLGIVLSDLARVGDIAKDPETPEWYRRRLRSSLHSAFGNALAVLLHALDRLDDWRPDLALKPTEHGTMGLAAQLGSMGIDHQLDVGEAFGDLDDDEPEGARWPSAPDKVPEASDEPWGSLARQRIMALTLMHLADRSMPEVERRALAWIAYHLTMSDHPDVAFLLPRFFARDIGASEEEAQTVLVSLTEKRLIHRETRLDDERRMAIKLIVDGLNDPRHEPAAN
jgi:hypothetical protein